MSEIVPSDHICAECGDDDDSCFCGIDEEFLFVDDIWGIGSEEAE